MNQDANVIALDGNSLTFTQAIAIAKGSAVKIAQTAKKRVDASHAFVETIAKQQDAVYGINTGFGLFASRRISQTQLKQLQVNILRSHAAGYGDALTPHETRLMMALRLNVLLQGYAGASYALCQGLLDLLQREIYPLVPCYGSVGASGDLIPLAHLALPLIGEGEVHFQGKRMLAKNALKKAGLKPYVLKEKEGLSLINGTQAMQAIGTLALEKALNLCLAADQITALSYEALHANPDTLNPFIHKIRRQQGQQESAACILNELKGSSLFTERKPRHLQDPYSLRCAPQVHGACRDALAYAKVIAERELNAATDNPLVHLEEQKIFSGGNFHGEPLALAFDFASLAVAELANISDRRLEVLLNPKMSALPAFLVEEGGLNSGLMTTQYLSACLVNENKTLAHPASVDSIPGNGGIEDFVSMGMTSARKFKQIVDNATVVLSLELLAAAQAIDLQEKRALGKGTYYSYCRLRDKIPYLSKDRILSSDIAIAVDLLTKTLQD